MDILIPIIVLLGVAVILFAAVGGRRGRRTGETDAPDDTDRPDKTGGDAG